MGCGCGKKKALAAAMVAGSVIDSIDADDWGPVFWKILHCFAAHCGLIGDTISDGDDARTMELLVGQLGYVLPCEECQGHARTWINEHPFAWTGLRGATLRNSIQLWLFTFHNAVRERKGQPIMFPTLAEALATYVECNIQPCEIEVLTVAAKYAIDHRIIKPPAWKRWYQEFNRFRLRTGA
jgi:Erv1 / Alr family